MSLVQLLRENLSNFSGPQGKVQLFVYANRSENSFVADPNDFGDSDPFLRNTYQRVEFPRILFYLTPIKQDRYEQAGFPLYTAKVNENQIYDLQVDPDGLKSEHTTDQGGRTDYHQLYNTLSEMGWSGVLITDNGDSLVSWFEPITVKLNASETEEQ